MLGQIAKKIKNVHIAVFVFILFSIIFGGSFVKFIPPLQAPDELGHYLKADALSRGEVVPVIYNKNNVENENAKSWNEFGFYASKGVEKIVKLSFTVGNYPENKFDYQKAEEDNYPSSGKVFLPTGGITNYSIINFIPQTLGILFGKVLNTSPLAQYYLARAFNLVCYIVLIAIAISLFPFSKWAAAIIGLNPLAIFLAASTSGDGLTNGVALLFSAYVLRLAAKKQLTEEIEESSNRLSSKKIMIAGLLLIIAVTMKPTNIVLGLLFFLIPNKDMNIRRKVVWGSVILALSIGLYLLWNSLMVDQQILYRDFANPNLQLRHFLSNPGIFFNNLIKNFIFGNKGNYILLSYMGNFGWLNTPIGWHWAILYYSLLIVSAFLPNQKAIFFRWPKKLVLGVALILFTLLTFFALYQIWNPVDTKKAIQGVQGRYFIPISFVFIPLFSTKEGTINVAQNKILIVIGSILVILWLAVLRILAVRYGF
ncbi:DUF2142 domain-containing protein [Enterococcus alishanensis]|uniref:DUF2142 domain-containing protein n=1 Tax=Enterococcus alishanensis TaxID=1303817 RepID=A0ABS6TBT0_9ENTE|nr:DUF2142 domain-containing protein [Enterococcus alishanensis]MBV7390358.1 DUF2142 domain-containing protein [Enterococcus alishanensis]